MSPRTGRPTNDPKTVHVGFRLNAEDAEKLQKCSEVLGLNTTDIIRRGINKVYDEVESLPDTMKNKKGSDTLNENKNK